MAIILVESSTGSPELLLIRRAVKEGDPWSGQMGLPGGRRDTADAGTLMGELDDFQPRNPLLPKVIVRPFVFGLPTRPEVIPNQEVALHLWASIDTLAGSSERTEVEIHGSRRIVDAYLLGPAKTPHVVWGMTHRILTPFLTLIT